MQRTRTLEVNEDEEMKRKKKELKMKNFKEKNWI